ncbi:PE-PGRS family protein [Streptomyces sp. 7-21]|jgi:hypothetical protein|uniref:PE-PGRS family protein n=1 Tax=Streptomyces sp. 7-21 TaxID=2802283 RepID=UPI00191E20A7|nr:PE-PGRS family protein [Streptomyces sp. 7-21]MBL1067748.1 PE-PGRS family protein [Streptomyces sp. 7-21]
MAGYRYAPEWDQHARRDTHIVDPVVSVRPLSRFEFTFRTPTRTVDYALVFSDGRGGCRVYYPPHRPTRHELAAGRYVSVHEVDTGLHHLDLELALPSDNNAFTYKATANLTWRVHAPEKVVTSGLRDVPALLENRLGQFLGDVTRDYPINDVRAAENAARAALSGVQIAGDTGLQLTYAVRLEPDEAARAHQDRLRQLQYQEQLAAPEFAVAERTQFYEHRLEMMRELNRQQLEAARGSFGREQERLQLVHEQQLLAERAKFYQWYLENQGVEGWSLQLAQHPEDLRHALSWLDAEGERKVKNYLAMLDGIKESGHVESYEMDEPRRQVLNAIREYFTDRPASLPRQAQAWEQDPRPAQGLPAGNRPGTETPPPADDGGK